MAEYIDRDDAIKAVNWQSAIVMTRAAMTYAIKSIPAADVAPVVQCKDCKHSWEDISGLVCSHRVCIDLNVPGDFYCAYGERKDG